MKTTKTTKTTKKPEGKLKVFAIKNEHGRFLKAVDGETWYDVKLYTTQRPNFTPFYIDMSVPNATEIEFTEFNPIIQVTSELAIFAPYYNIDTKEVEYI